MEGSTILPRSQRPAGKHPFQNRQGIRVSKLDLKPSRIWELLKKKLGDFLKKTRKIEENSFKNREIDSLEDEMDLKLAISRLKSAKNEELVSQEDFEKLFGVKLDAVAPLKDEEIE